MKSILLVLGAGRYREALLGAVAAIRAGGRSSLHLMGSCPEAAGDGHEGATAEHLRRAGEPSPANADIAQPHQPEEILARARVVHADLIVLAPALPPDSGPLWMDPLVARVAAEAEQAVLVFRDSEHWPPRKALLPLVEPDAAATTLTRAAIWLDTLFGSSDGEKVASVPELHVLRVAADMERWYQMNDSLAAAAGELRDGFRVRMQDGMRFGREPTRRILRWINQEAPDLVVLGRQLPAGGAQPKDDQGWLRVLQGTRSSVLLLPRPKPVEPPREGDGGSLWRRVSGLWPRA